ncbi:MBG domain-containing protein, partial [Secundilactobacillus silagincola]|uniref:MBG domain-containing protein n=1 Tax=Secundilactobacillus silagincola TaxID=1714681 RepID=UPI0015D51A1F
QFNVKLSTGLVAPKWQAEDFDLSGITSANVGSSVIKLSDTGLQKLQKANPNYTIESANVTDGQFHITAAPVTIIAPTLTKSYDGQSYTGNDNQAKVVGQQAAKLNYSLTDLSQDTNVQTNGYAITVQLGDNPNYNVKTV